MSTVTSELTVTIPKAIAERYGIVPGDEVEFVPEGPSIRLVPAAAAERPLDVAERLRLFDESVERQRTRQDERAWGPATAGELRGWTRDDLYEPPRGMPRGWQL